MAVAEDGPRRQDYLDMTVTNEGRRTARADALRRWEWDGARPSSTFATYEDAAQ